jgi:hypothetical protein
MEGGRRTRRFVSILEHQRMNHNGFPTGFVADLKEEYLPGDLGFDPLGLAPKDVDGFIEMQNKELNNGRLAMIAVAGQVAQELVNGKGLIENLTS